MSKKGVESTHAKANKEPKPKEKSVHRHLQNNEKKISRSTYFTVKETDLLLSLHMASDLNSQAINKITPYGRIKNWRDLHRIFISSPRVHQREEKALRARLHNIRTGLFKLSAFSKSMVSPTGGALLSPSNPPKVPFKLTPIVRQYAAANAMQITGLPPCGDSEGPASSIVPPSCRTALQSPLFALSNVIAPSISDSDMPSNTLTAKEEILSSAEEVEEEDREWNASLYEPSTSSTPTPSQQFFATTRQQCKCDVSSSSSSSQQLYFEEKTTLVAAEIARRTELHALDMQIKREELAAKQHMTAFWHLATQRLESNEIRIGDIVSGGIISV